MKAWEANVVISGSSSTHLQYLDTRVYGVDDETNNYEGFFTRGGDYSVVDTTRPFDL
jgi:hypothetical protein